MQMEELVFMPTTNCIYRAYVYLPLRTFQGVGEDLPFPLEVCNVQEMFTT